jgi:hypothetical protein
MFNKQFFITIFFTLIITTPTLSKDIDALQEKSLIRDSLDNAIDFSDYLMSKHGFLPIPMIVTEPAVGYGGGAALLYFHKKKSNLHTENIVTAKTPSITFGGGGYTTSNSWTVFLGHYGLLRGDKIRYLGVGGYLDLSIDIHFNDIIISSNSFNLPLTISGLLLLQELQFRVKESPLFLGARYNIFFNKNELSFENIEDSTGYELPNADLEARDAALSFITVFDTRNNIFSPTKGLKIDNFASLYSLYLGGTGTFIINKTTALGFYPFLKRLSGGLKFELIAATEETPLYLLPFIELRGIPAMRYQGNVVLSSEAQLNFLITKRFKLLGFGGVGQAGDKFDQFSETDIKYNFGGGFRYLLARKLGLNMGIDIAKGPEEWAIYIVTGSAWL